jgi:xylan 1,4-beta-xylosidase
VHRSCFPKALISSLLILILGISAHSQSSGQQIVIDAGATATPFPHFWEQMFGSGRASLSLRESYRNDLREVRRATDFRYVRFHAIFHDEVGVYNQDEHGQPVYNFSYVDQIYDGLLADGARPFVELSFMPNALAARNMPHAFWYKPNISPPKDWDKWDALVTQFAKHLIERYGIDEIGHWYFEVWNEQAVYLLGAVRPHGESAKSCGRSIACRRTGDGAGSMGRCLHRALREEPGAGGFRFFACLRQ